LAYDLPSESCIALALYLNEGRNAVLIEKEVIDGEAITSTFLRLNALFTPKQ